MSRFALLPQIAFVGGVLDVVADVVVHSMSCCAVSGIKHLDGKNETTAAGLGTKMPIDLSKYTAYRYAYGLPAFHL